MTPLAVVPEPHVFNEEEESRGREVGWAEVS